MSAPIMNIQLCYGMKLVTADLAKIVLDKCIIREEVDNNGTPYTTQIMYNYEFIDDFEEPQLGSVGKFLLKNVQKEEKDIPLEMINHPVENSHRGSTVSFLSVESNKEASTMLLTKNWGPKVYDKDNHTLSLMVRVITCNILNA